MSILLIIAGVISLGIAAAIYYIYQTFFAGSARTIPGKVVEITNNEYVSKDAFGHVSDVTEADEPIIEFFYSGKTFRFKANIDAHAKSLNIGSIVNVVINEQKYPNVAKLAEEATSYQVMMAISGLLGGVFLVVGIGLLDWRDVVASLNVVTLAWFIGALLALWFAVRKVILMKKEMPLFPQNIVEVDDKSR